MKKIITLFFDNLNTCRLFTSGAFFMFAIYCLIWNRELPFHLPGWLTFIAFCYFALFPLKDLFAATTRSLYKGKQFKGNYLPVDTLDEASFQTIKRRYDRGALFSILFGLVF